MFGFFFFVHLRCFLPYNFWTELHTACTEHTLLFFHYRWPSFSLAETRHSRHGNDLIHGSPCLAFSLPPLFDLYLCCIANYLSFTLVRLI